MQPHPSSPSMSGYSTARRHTPSTCIVSTYAIPDLRSAARLTDRIPQTIAMPATRPPTIAHETSYSTIHSEETYGRIASTCRGIVKTADVASTATALQVIMSLAMVLRRFATRRARIGSGRNGTSRDIQRTLATKRTGATMSASAYETTATNPDANNVMNAPQAAIAAYFRACACQDTAYFKGRPSRSSRRSPSTYRAARAWDASADPTVR